MMLLLSSKGQISPHINDEILQHLRSCTAYSIFFYKKLIHFDGVNRNNINTIV